MTTPTPPLFGLDSPPNGPAEIAAVVAWVQTCLSDLPAAVDSGQVTVNAVVNDVTAFQVTFAPGLFTSAPFVTLSPNSTRPDTVDVSYHGTTTTGFTGYIYRVGATGAAPVATVINWQAIQKLGT